jgi:hypothetical protein
MWLPKLGRNMSSFPFNLVLHAIVLLTFGCLMLAMTHLPWLSVSLIVFGSPFMYYWDLEVSNTIGATMAN